VVDKTLIADEEDAQASACDLNAAVCSRQQRIAMDWRTTPRSMVKGGITRDVW
jgi:hypothetical protein